MPTFHRLSVLLGWRTLDGLQGRLEILASVDSAELLRTPNSSHGAGTLGGVQVIDIKLVCGEVIDVHLVEDVEDLKDVREAGLMVKHVNLKVYVLSEIGRMTSLGFQKAADEFCDRLSLTSAMKLVKSVVRCSKALAIGSCACGY